MCSIFKTIKAMQLSKKKIHVYKSTNTTPKSYIIKMIVTVKITFNFFFYKFLLT